MTRWRTLAAVIGFAGIACVSVATVFGFAWIAGGSVASAAEFDHATHAKVVPRCVACHAGVAQPGRSVMPDVVSCASCHDGRVEKIVEWSPAPAREGLLRFDHASHRDEVRAANDDPLDCATCHALAGESAAVVRPDPARCFECHGGEHYAAATNCASCHRPLSGARDLTVADVAAFARPSWHDEPDFAGPGHGAHCPRDGDSSCAVCHATQFCQICHVDAPENEAIRALGDDVRSLALHAELRAPSDHAADSFLVEHGHEMDDAACETCHTQESCSTCHVAGTNVASTLHRASPERGVGAVVERRMPPSHTAWFREAHGAEASANAQNCAGCHARDQCLDCHLPGAADATSRYHDLAFLARHPSAAYGQETSCADCHNPVTFCASCHQSSGLVSMRGRLGSGYHDGQESFLFGHGPAARRTLEACVSCHTESDCMLCHASGSVGGRGFDPHGPGFDAARLLERAPQMCTVCHGAAIPGRTR